MPKNAKLEPVHKLARSPEADPAEEHRKGLEVLATAKDPEPYERDHATEALVTAKQKGKAKRK